MRIKKLNELAKIPSYACHGDAGLDLTATSITETDQYIEYGTGLAIEIPYGFVGLLFPRSSVSKYDLQLANSVGVIDHGYKNEVKVRFRRLKESDVKEYHIGDKICQLVVMPIAIIEKIEIVDDLGESERGMGGFGHSGK